MSNFLFTKVFAEENKFNSNVTGGNRSISFDEFFSNVNEQIITPIIYLLFSLAIVYFLYGVYVFIKNAESPEKRSEGAKSIIWGIIGMFIMISVKGIINLILGTIGAN